MTTQVTCPQCGKQMVRRTRKSDGAPFYGCSQFPTCRGTRNITEPRPAVQPTTVKPYPVGPITGWEAKYSINGKPFNPSQRQLDILDFVTNKPGNLFVEAYAGTGKSTTAAFVINQLPRSLQVVYFAFNKAIAKEFREKYGLNAMTMHSFGYSCLQNALGKLTVDGNKKNKIANTYFPQHKVIRRFVTRMASLAINTCTDYTDIEALKALIDKYGIELDESVLEAKDDTGREIPYDYILSTVASIVLDSFQAVEDEHVIDYDEMLAYPVFADLIPRKWDWIFVDEAQDTNALQIQFVSKAIKETGRYVFVGDRHQAIYGFRGAMVDAVDQIIAATGAKILPLDITYRCPQSHVRELANPIVAGIKAAPGNAEGEIRYNVSQNTALKEWKELDEALVLCRTNAPLIKQALGLIKTGKKARVAGRDIAEGLVSLIERVDAVTVEELTSKLETYRDKECARLIAADKEDQADLLTDKVECILAVAEGEQTVIAVINRIDMIFSDDRGGILFSSVHRAKGLEAKEVYIIEPNQLPFKSSKPWQFIQECNLAYVAFTRSLYRMTFVEGRPNMGKLASCFCGQNTDDDDYSVTGY